MEMTETKTNKTSCARVSELPEIPLEYAMLVEFMLWGMAGQKDKELRNGQCVALFGALRASMAVGLIPEQAYFRAVGIASNAADLYTLGEEGDDQIAHLADRLLECFGLVGVRAAKLDATALKAFLRDFLDVAYRVGRAERRLFRKNDKDELVEISAGTRNQLIGMLWGGQTLGLFSKERMFKALDEVDVMTRRQWLQEKDIFFVVERVFELDPSFRQEEINVGRLPKSYERPEAVTN